MHKILVGLGNPGDKYTFTRHNAGFMLADYLGHSWRTGKDDFTLVKKIDALALHLGEWRIIKPQLFMNRSGEVVAKALHYYKIPAENLYVAHDDLDIKFGNYKIHYGKGPKVHNGILSIEEQLKTKDFWRIRIGVEQRTEEERATIPGHHYVLSPFSGGLEGELRQAFAEIEDEITR